MGATRMACRYTGDFSRDTIYPLTTPAQILRWPELSFIDKAKLAWLTLHAKNIDLLSLDDIPAETYILDHLAPISIHHFLNPCSGVNSERT